MRLSTVLEYFRSQFVDCRLCPWQCAVNRRDGETGFCKAGAELKVASYCIHSGEEPPISGTRGSGTIFFAHCNMACVYCQNYPISQLGYGNPVSTGRLAEMMLELQGRGAHNINLVTSTHYLPLVVESVLEARAKGLTVPIVHNISGYERPETIRLLDGIIQIYLADMRYARAETGLKYSGAPDYPLHNRLAIREMYRQVGDLQTRDGVATGGLIVRHLVLPSLVAETRDILEFISREISRKTAVSLMSQYFPANRASDYPDIARRISASEYEEAVRLLEEFGLDTGWIQDLGGSGLPVA